MRRYFFKHNQLLFSEKPTIKLARGQEKRRFLYELTAGRDIKIVQVLSHNICIYPSISDINKPNIKVKFKLMINPRNTNSLTFRTALNTTTTTTSTKPSSNLPQTNQTRKTKPSVQNTESARRAGLARATSVRTISKPTRALARTKSDNAGKNTGSGDRPAWRF